MKRKIFLVSCCLCLLTQLSAQPSKGIKLRLANEELRQAMIDGNRAGLEKLTHRDLSYGHSSGYIEGKAEFVEKIVSGKSDFVSIDLTEESFAISGKTAIVRHILKAKTNDGGKPGEVSLRILLLWKKQGGQWKLLARQAVKINP